jgi:hypothetical protein
LHPWCLLSLTGIAFQRERTYHKRKASSKIELGVLPVPNYPTPHSLALDPPVSCIMTTLEHLNVDSRSATTAALNADIETLTAAKDTLGIISVKVVFESVIVILTLVRVRDPVMFPYLCSLLDNTIRTRW